ncbi:MAG TPA: AfsR/SARP family transcriptional regulator, partial [Pseudonocardiaceae bacterium]
MAGSPDTLRVQVLGPIQAWRGDTEIRLGPTRQRALFAVLALRRDRMVGRDELINAVWGQDAPTTAEGSIYTYVSGLRRALEPDRSQRAASTLLPSEGTGYRLHLAADALDAVQFDALRVEAAETLARQAADDAIELTDRAMALWHGEPLTGLPGPFATACREQLTAARRSLLETRAAAGLLGGRHIELVPELATLVAQNPLHEGLRGLLMIALYRSGRQADALDQFRQARQALVAELGTQPGTRLTEIHQQILAADPALAAPEREPATAPVRWSTRPRARANAFVNRTSELTSLRHAMSSLVDGRGFAVWVEGEPGIGKSELLTNGLADIDNGHVQLCW